MVHKLLTDPLSRNEVWWELIHCERLSQFIKTDKKEYSQPCRRSFFCPWFLRWRKRCFCLLEQQCILFIDGTIKLRNNFIFMREEIKGVVHSLTTNISQNVLFATNVQSYCVLKYWFLHLLSSTIDNFSATKWLWCNRCRNQYDWNVNPELDTHKNS